MPQYRNDTAGPVAVTDIHGAPVMVASGAAITTYEVRTDLTELAAAPYWSPALAVHLPAGAGDLAPIDLAAACHAVEIWNDSAATLTVRLRSAAAVALTIPPYASRRVDGPPGLDLADVADVLQISASAAITAGQLVVTELREEGD